MKSNYNKYELLFSSSVEKLEREHRVIWQIIPGTKFDQERVEEDRYHLAFYPRRHIIDIENVTVILDQAVSSKGTSPRYMVDENIMFFADEVHRVAFLKRMGLEDEWIENNLLPGAEVIPFPKFTQPEEAEVALAM